MKRILSLVASIMVVISGISGAETIGSKSGTTTGEFLRIGVGARPVAMGEAFAAVAEDASALYWNPAGIARLSSRDLLVAHTLWYMDVSHDYLAYAQPLGKVGAIGISATYLMTSFDKRLGDTETPDSTGSVGDMALGLTYARTLPWDVDGGFTLKYINSKLDTNSATSVAFDLGLRKQCPYWKNLTAGVVVTDMGGSLKYINDAVAIGSTLDLGLSLKDAVLKNLLASADYRNLINGSESSINIGAEYAFKVNNDISFGPRVGFESYSSLFSAGLGFGWKEYQLDYAFVSQGDLGNNNRISFSAKF